MRCAEGIILIWIIPELQISILQTISSEQGWPTKAPSKMQVICPFEYTLYIILPNLFPPNLT